MTTLPERSPRAERRERALASRRSDVVAAASAVFAQKGFDGAQVNEIAAAAELSLASVYTLFKGKDELFEEVIATAAQAMREGVLRRVEAIEDPKEQLLTVGDALFACFEENQDLLRIYARGTHGLSWKIRQVMGERSLEIFRAFTAWVTEIASRAASAGQIGNLDPEVLTLSLLGAVTTTATHCVESEPDQPLDRFAPDVRAIFERALAAGEPS